MRGLPRDVKAALLKARESAILAVDTYNRPATAFRSGAYIVLMVIAWTALFHAIFFRRGIKPFHIKVKRGRYLRYKTVDGDYQAWELAECVRQFFLDQNTAVRKNLEFFIGLRNKIEHRRMPQLDDHIFGECQALLLNFEALLYREFGERYSLNESLAVALQFSSITPTGKLAALRRLQATAYPSVTDYVTQFRSSLSDDIQASMEYSFKVFLLPKTGTHANSSDLAVEFISVDSLDEEHLQEYERIVALIKTREVAVAQPGLLRPSDVVKEVRLRLGSRFTTSDHVRCWKHFGIRPSRDAADPRRCQPKYCQYDVPHRDYVYTDAWVELLVSKLSDPAIYQQILGKPPPQL